MRKTERSGWDVLKSSGTLARGVRLAVVAAGVAAVLAPGLARAQDDQDDSTFEEKIIHNLMSGIGATNMDSKGIDYRERSPLVIPPKIDLPPPGSAKAEIKEPNWPKDPDLQRHKAERAANNRKKPEPWEGGRSILPSQLSPGGSGTVRSAEAEQPGKPQNDNPSLSPTELGFTSKLSDFFGGGNKPQTAPFTGEPDREALTQPPAGYQTPSPNFAYGTGPQKPLMGTHTDIMTGKEVAN